MAKKRGGRKLKKEKVISVEVNYEEEVNEPAIEDTITDSEHSFVSDGSISSDEDDHLTFDEFMAKLNSQEFAEKCAEERKIANLKATDTTPKKAPSPPPKISEEDFLPSEVTPEILESISPTEVTPSLEKPSAMEEREEEPTNEPDRYKEQILLPRAVLLTKISQEKTATPRKKSIFYVIAGLPKSTTIFQVIDELFHRKVVLNSVDRLRKRGKTLRPFVIATTTDEQQLKKIKYMLNRRIRIETLNKKAAPIQCYNCNSFGHIAANCISQPKCDFCSNAHNTRECTLKDSGTVPTCINCGQNHRARNRICLARPNLKKQRELATSDKLPMATPRHRPRQASAPRRRIDFPESPKESILEELKREVSKAELNELLFKLKSSPDPKEKRRIILMDLCGT